MRKKLKTIKVGDVIWIEAIGELIEVLSCLADEGTLQYWGSSKPHQVGTRKCMEMTAWIAFSGQKVTNVGDMRTIYKEFQ